MTAHALRGVHKPTHVKSLGNFSMGRVCVAQPAGTVAGGHPRRRGCQCHATWQSRRCGRTPATVLAGRATGTPCREIAQSLDACRPTHSV